jgi:hypothetical protein
MPFNVAPELERPDLSVPGNGPTGREIGDMKYQSGVGRWDEIKTAVSEFYDIAGYDYVELEDGVYDAEGTLHEGHTYFVRQLEYCKNQQENAKALSTFIEASGNKVYLKRLKKDFFQSSWDCLTSKTQKALLEAEQKWDTAEGIGSDTDSVVMEYHRALEIELREAVFSHAASTIDRMIKAGVLKPPSGDYSALSLSLTHMRMLISDVIDGKSDSLTSELRECLNSIPMTVQDRKDFAATILNSGFIAFLRDINKKRKDNEHFTDAEVRQMEVIRCRVLGIGSLGYLPLLARIKEETQKRAI